MNRIWRLISGGLAFLVAILAALASKRKADAKEAKAETEAVKAAGAKAQLDQLERAQAAAREAGVEAQAEVDNAKENVRRGNLSGMDNDF